MQHTSKKPISPAPVAIDHLRYLNERRHRREVHAAIRRTIRRGGVVTTSTVEHEHDLSCCQAQPWTVTRTRIIAALRADGVEALGLTILVGRPPAA
jgi:hypothetical protein